MTSSKPLNTNLETRSSDIPCYSAGHTKHEWTSWACIDVLFPFLEEKYEEFVKNGGENNEDPAKESDEHNDTDEKEADEDEDAGGSNDQEEALDLSSGETVENKNGKEKADVKSDQSDQAAAEESTDDGQNEPKKPNKHEDL